MDRDVEFAGYLREAVGPTHSGPSTQTSMWTRSRHPSMKGRRSSWRQWRRRVYIVVMRPGAKAAELRGYVDADHLVSLIVGYA